MRHVSRVRALALALIAAAAIAACASPASAAREAQQMNDIGDQLNDMRNESAGLAASLDSMRTVIAKQDTTIQKLASAAGIAVVK